MERSGAQIVWEALKREDVEVVFGLPGGAIIHTYHPRSDYGIRHVLVRHEQGAAHAADGYARASGRVGVALVTSGPGATNLVTGIATAMMDSSPIVCITGQVATSVLGTDAFQEIDITGITLPITKHNYLVTDVNDLADIIHEAFEVARSPRPGPVLIDLPSDVQRSTTQLHPAEHRPLRRPHSSGSAALRHASPETVKRINGARRPLILAGHGILMAGAQGTLRSFCEKTGIPVATTLLGKGTIAATHPLSVGLMGMHGDAATNHAIQQADLLIAIGMRFADRVTGTLCTYAPEAYKIHIDIDVSELNKVIAVDAPIQGDAKEILEELLEQASANVHAEWLEEIGAWKGQSRLRDIVHHPMNGSLPPPLVIDAISRATRGEAIVVTDVGQNQMWAAQYYHPCVGNPFITPGGLGTMGFGLPAAIGAQIAQPEKEVWAIVGDGGLQMTVQELATVAQERLPLRIALINNGYLGMVRQWQEWFFEQRYEATRLVNPDFLRLAEAYGIQGWRAQTCEACGEVIAAARAHSGPALVEFVTAQTGDGANVYPMVPPGAALDEMILRGQTRSGVRQ
jgi:acetolactate synthase I/II/III large subunit